MGRRTEWPLNVVDGEEVTLTDKIRIIGHRRNFADNGAISNAVLVDVMLRFAPVILSGRIIHGAVSFTV